METTFDKFINNNAEQKAMFEQEYAEFAESENLLARATAGHTPTINRAINRPKVYA